MNGANARLNDHLSQNRRSTLAFSYLKFASSTRTQTQRYVRTIRYQIQVRVIEQMTSVFLRYYCTAWFVVYCIPLSHSSKRSTTVPINMKEIDGDKILIYTVSIALAIVMGVFIDKIPRTRGKNPIFHAAFVVASILLLVFLPEVIQDEVFSPGGVGKKCSEEGQRLLGKNHSLTYSSLFFSCSWHSLASLHKYRGCLHQRRR